MMKFKSAPNTPCDSCAIPLDRGPWVEWSFNGGVPFSIHLCLYCTSTVSQRLRNNVHNIRRLQAAH